MAERVSYNQIQAAKNVNLIDFLESEYPEYIAYSPKTKEYVHPEHNSLKIYEKGFYRFSNGGKDQGDNIRYLNEWCGVMTFQAAVLQLCQFDGSAGASDVQIIDVKRKSRTSTEREDKPFPKKAAQNVELMTYLISNRGIDRDTVDMLLSQGVIYQDTRKNVIFINESTNWGVARGTGDEGFKKILKSGNGYWRFIAGEDPQEVYITESPIDAISLYILLGKAPGIYIALGGVKIKSFTRAAVDHSEYKIKIAPDWDEAGQKFVKECFKTWPCVVYFKPKEERLQAFPNCKDWNELLLAEKKQKEQQREKERAERLKKLMAEKNK